VNGEDGRLIFDYCIAWQPATPEEKNNITISTSGNAMLFYPAIKLTVDDIDTANTME
jgi:hypothetical protein